MFPLDRLDFLLGSHVGVDHIHASAWTDEEEAAGTSDAALELGGRVSTRRVRAHLSKGTFETLEIFMADPTSNEVLHYAFDTLGYPADPPSRGSWTDGRLVLLRSTSRGQSRTTFAPVKGGDGFTWTKEYRASAEMAWQPVVSGAFD